MVGSGSLPSWCAAMVRGEAAPPIPPEVRGLWPDMPLGDLVAVRDRLIHAHFGVEHQGPRRQPEALRQQFQAGD